MNLDLLFQVFVPLAIIVQQVLLLLYPALLVPTNPMQVRRHVLIVRLVITVINKECLSSLHFKSAIQDITAWVEVYCQIQKQMVEQLQKVIFVNLVSIVRRVLLQWHPVLKVIMSQEQVQLLVKNVQQDIIVLKQ